MNTLSVVMSREEIKAIVESTNSFPKEVIEANREVIRELRAEKRERLAQASGSHVAILVDRYKSQGFVLTEHKEKQGKKTDTVSFTMKRKSNVSDLERAQKELAKLQERIARLTAVAA